MLRTGARRDFLAPASARLIPDAMFPIAARDTLPLKSMRRWGA